MKFNIENNVWNKWRWNKKTIYLLDGKLGIKDKDYGKVSDNIVEKIVEIVPITDLYRKAGIAKKEKKTREFCEMECSY